jgi:hypothetical protein
MVYSGAEFRTGAWSYRVKVTRLVVCCGLTIGLALTAQPAQAVEAQLDATLAAYRWIEHPPQVDPPPEETGPMLLLGGFIAGSPVAARPQLTLRGEARLMLGRVQYDTALISSPSTRVSTHTGYAGLTQEGSVGWRMSGPRWRVEPFLGVAYRWWLRNIESTGNVSGYPEWYHTIVGRVGLRLEQTPPGPRPKSAVAEPIRVYGALSADPLLWSQEVVDLTDVGSTSVVLSNGLRVGWTLEAGLRQAGASVGVFWQAVRFGESNVVPPGVLQPESSQDILGLKVAASF